MTGAAAVPLPQRILPCSEGLRGVRHLNDAAAMWRVLTKMRVSMPGVWHHEKLQTHMPAQMSQLNLVKHGTLTMRASAAMARVLKKMSVCSSTEARPANCALRCRSLRLPVRSRSAARSCACFTTVKYSLQTM